MQSLGGTVATASDLIVGFLPWCLYGFNMVADRYTLMGVLTSTSCNGQVFRRWGPSSESWRNWTQWTRNQTRHSGAFSFFFLYFIFLEFWNFSKLLIQRCQLSTRNWASDWLKPARVHLPLRTLSARRNGTWGNESNNQKKRKKERKKERKKTCSFCTCR